MHAVWTLFQTMALIPTSSLAFVSYKSTTKNFDPFHSSRAFQIHQVKAHTSLSLSKSISAMAEHQIRTPQIACFWIGIYGVIQVALWIKIMTIRATKPSETHRLGNLAKNADSENLRATRAHGNYTENAPIFALMLLAADMAGIIAPRVLDATGFVFATGRLFHALGMHSNEGSSVGRMSGAILTLLSLSVAAVQCLFSAFALSWHMCRLRCICLAVSLVVAIAIAGKDPGAKGNNSN